MRVMVIDDDPFVRAVTETALAQLDGVTVQGFAGGAAALEAAGGFRPDVVVLDLAMSGMDGPATWHRLKAIVSGAMRLIILSADEQAASREDVKAMNPIGFIPKPFEPAAMAAAVAGLIGIAAPASRGDRRAAVAEAFRASLPATARTITAALADFQRGSRHAHDALLAEAHRLAGSASLFGYGAVGRLADRIEGDLRGLARGEPIDAAAVHDACAALARACETAGRETGAG